MALRYFDTARDFQSGLQRADGRTRPGAGTVIELPAALAAGDARALINAAAEQAGWALEGLAWRMAELDPTLAPGMIVRAHRLLQENPSPTEEEIRFGIAGNLCRCTGYQNIVKAIQYASAKINGVEFREAAE